MTAPPLLRSCGELLRSQALALTVLALWTLAPLVVLVIYASGHHDTLTGAAGYDPYDQLAYLAWIRDAGSHGLASDLWMVAPTAHDYLQPMFFVSGLLWRLGVSVQVAYLIWVPVGLMVLFLGFAAYVRRRLAGGRWQRTSALLLACFYLTPALAFAQWTGHLSFAHRLDLQAALYDSDSALNLWGFEHAAIAIGLMPVFLIAVERVLGAGDSGGSARVRSRWLAVAAVAGALVSWLQPWQGVTLLGIVAGMALLVAPRRRYLILTVPVVALVLPLVYGVALSRYDPVWHSFTVKTEQGTIGPWWALVVGFVPIGIFAALGVRRPRGDGDWMLLLWVVACAGVYLFVPEFPPHALKGVTLPLAVLAVGGWERCRGRLGRRRAWSASWGRPGAVGLAVLAIAVFTVPAGIAQLHAADSYMGQSPAALVTRQLLLLTPDEVAALRYLDRAPQPGAVLASAYFSMTVPAFTGRPVYAGHLMWQPATNWARAGAFFGPPDPGARTRRAILRASRARFVIANCGTAPSLATDIAPLAQPVARFGCLTVYRTRGS